ncbi:MAG TPA: hypothetical protein VFQ43_11440, partial [Nitrososphaera sp.]|nr:hypothetical protein [Nitrososphaera sp.]
MSKIKSQIKSNPGSIPLTCERTVAGTGNISIHEKISISRDSFMDGGRICLFAHCRLDRGTCRTWAGLLEKLQTYFNQNPTVLSEPPLSEV